MSVRPRVHQVLATLGYGDAIGHEVLGVQRVLRGAGYESEIFVETADRRLEDRTIDYREMVGAIAPEDVLIHHFSIGSRASRTAYALPGRMALVYHNITPPHYFVGVHRDLVKQCFRGRRELTAYIDRSDLALGDSEYNRKELEALGFPHTGVLPVVPDFSHLSGAPSQLLAAGFDDGWTNVMFVGTGHPEQEVRDRHPRVPRLPDAPQSARAAAARRLLQRLRALPVDAAAAHRQPRHARRALPRARLERGAQRALRRRGSVPLRERARGLLRPDHRGLPQGRPGAGLRLDRGARDHGWRRRALRHDRPARDRAPHGSGPRRSRARGCRAAVAGCRAVAAAGP